MLISSWPTTSWLWKPHISMYCFTKLPLYVHGSALHWRRAWSDCRWGQSVLSHTERSVRVAVHKPSSSLWSVRPRELSGKLRVIWSDESSITIFSTSGWVNQEEWNMWRPGDISVACYRPRVPIEGGSRLFPQSTGHEGALFSDVTHAL